MHIGSIRAKGVEPLASVKATLHGWRLVFNVRHFFQHEGGVASIVPAGPADQAHGVLYSCEDEALTNLDAAEAYGYGYDRVQVGVITADGPVTATAYIGMPSFIDDSCLPSRRYLNILCAGAEKAGIDPAYVEKLRQHPTHAKQDYPPFIFPEEPKARFNTQSIAANRHLTALAGAVFDMSAARPQHEYLKKFFGGRDMTLFHLKRMDSSDGSETLDDIIHDRLSPAQRHYLNEYLHEYSIEYSYAGRFDMI